MKDRRQSTKTIVGDRVFDYQVNGIHVTLLEFSTAEAMNSWADMIGSMPIGGSRIIRGKRVAIQVWPGPDDRRQDMITRLKQ